MTKTELIESLIKKQPHLNKKDVQLAVDCIFERIAQALAAKERMEIRGFGTFSLHYRGPRRGRNLISGEILTLPAMNVPHFKPAKNLRKRVALSSWRFQSQTEMQPSADTNSPSQRG